MFGWIRMPRELWQFGLQRERRRARRGTSPARPCLEQLEDRRTPSVASADPLLDSVPMISSLVREETQMFAAMQNGVIRIATAIAQQVAQTDAYLLLRLEQIFGIAPNPQNLSLNSQISTAGIGSGSGNDTTTTQPSVGIQPSAPVEPDAAPGGPLAVGASYLWDPPNPGSNILANNPVNWLLDGQRQGPNGTFPGNLPQDVAAFDPGSGFIKDGHGNAPIEWNYSKPFLTMNLGANAPYTGLQTIDANTKVELTDSTTALSMPNTTSILNLDFTDGTSKFQIDGNSTITNMTLAGNRAGQFIINGGTTMIAGKPGAGNPTYKDTIGAQVIINPNATLQDGSYNALTFTNNNLQITVMGKMLGSVW